MKLEERVGGTDLVFSPVRSSLAGTKWVCCPLDDTGIPYGGGGWGQSTPKWKLLSHLLPLNQKHRGPWWQFSRSSLKRWVITPVHLSSLLGCLSQFLVTVFFILFLSSSLSESLGFLKSRIWGKDFGVGCLFGRWSQKAEVRKSTSQYRCALSWALMLAKKCLIPLTSWITLRRAQNSPPQRLGDRNMVSPVHWGSSLEVWITLH